MYNCLSSFHRFASSMCEKSRGYLLLLNHYSTFASFISETEIKIHKKLKVMFFQSTTLVYSLDQRCNCTFMTYYRPEPCAAVFQSCISWKFDIVICDTNCQLRVEEISSSLMNIKLLWKNVLLKQAFLLRMKEFIYYYWHDNWNHTQQNEWWRIYNQAFWKKGQRWIRRRKSMSMLSQIIQGLISLTKWWNNEKLFWPSIIVSNEYQKDYSEENFLVSHCNR